MEDVKKIIAGEAKVGDFNRIGLSNPETKKLFKDRKALVSDVAGNGELLVKDLGMFGVSSHLCLLKANSFVIIGAQISWRAVFVIEYFGPILFHLLIVAIRPYIFPGGDAELSPTQRLVFAMFIGHFLKREVETLFIHKFSANTMPISNVFRNSAFYWLMAGLVCAVSVYYPKSFAAVANEPLIDYAGLALFLFGETGNALVHLYLASLRSSGGTERKIPHGYGFALVTCPNYMYEVISWVGVIITSRDITVVAFIAVGISFMYPWAKDKEAAYRKEFPDKYKKKKYRMLPGLL